MNVKGFLVIRDSIIDKIMYREVNFIPSRYALDLVFLPRMIDAIRMEIMGINSLIIFVGKI